MTDKTIISKTEVLPHSIEAEQSVLGGLMLDNNSWDQIADRVTGNDFYRNDHRIIFEAMSAIVKRQQPLDTLTLAETLKEQNKLDAAGGEGYLFSLAKNTPSAANIKAYADIVRERSVLRQLLDVSGKIADQELLDLAEQKVFSIAEQWSRGSQAKEKYKETKKIALEIYIRLMVAYNTDKGERAFFNENPPMVLAHLAWLDAVDFYDYAKEKEGGNEIHPGCWTCSLCKNWFKNNVKYYCVNMEGKYFCSKECVLKDIENDEKEKGEKQDA